MSRVLTEAQKEAKRETTRSWIKNNPERARATQRAWIEANPESLRVATHNYRARKRHREATLTIEEWTAILDRFLWRCAYCLGPYECLDHVVSLKRGGGTTADNVVPACIDCNNRKESTNTGWTPSITSEFWPWLAEELYTTNQPKGR